MTKYDAIDPTELDQHTLREVKRLVESYSVVSSDETYHELDSYRQGKTDAYTNIAAVLSDWIDELDES
ncbi:hypothetical protein HISP_10860 [Haloarcula hispanica N601]|uniref:Uncharacterized protein n=2 Tax=Haloarcula hispanica TaxID=51589 RepID=V5TP86_HALHI|nr:hypothetical protein [Haloarcula hispanica]AEM57721.1 hypothetical protein HAH_2130 [Haloarcula hispanica ATCC 33960]AHB66470.1 hypothetical protein HISP_10860 [Haloarcula hispanica N601]